MKSRMLTWTIAISLLATLAGSPLRLAAQENRAKRHRYKLIDLGTFGGTTSYVNPVGNGGPYMNRKGDVVGSSMTSIPPRSNGNFPCPAALGSSTLWHGSMAV